MLPIGQYANANDLATGLLMGILFWWFMVADPAHSIFVRVLGLGVLGAAFPALVKTGSRAAMIVVIVALPMLLFQRSLANRLRLVVVGAVLVAIAVAALPGQLRERYLTFLAPPDAAERGRPLTAAEQAIFESAVGSTQSRMELFRDSVTASRSEHPVLGVGLGMFAVAESDDALTQGISRLVEGNAQHLHAGFLRGGNTSACHAAGDSGLGFPDAEDHAEGERAEPSSVQATHCRRRGHAPCVPAGDLSWIIVHARGLQPDDPDLHRRRVRPCREHPGRDQRRRRSDPRSSGRLARARGDSAAHASRPETRAPAIPGRSSPRLPPAFSAGLARRETCGVGRVRSAEVRIRGGLDDEVICSGVRNLHALGAGGVCCGPYPPTATTPDRVAGPAKVMRKPGRGSRQRPAFRGRQRASRRDLRPLG